MCLQGTHFEFGRLGGGSVVKEEEFGILVDWTSRESSSGDILGILVAFKLAQYFNNMSLSVWKQQGIFFIFF